METSDFSKNFEHYPSVQKHFKGVFPLDVVPRKLHRRQFIIVNTE